MANPHPSSTPQPTVAAPSSAADDVLRGFLAARVAGEGAQQYLNVPEEDIPLLYATTSGAPYERAEFDRVRGIEWPYGLTAFGVRLFAGDTVVEQLFFRAPTVARGSSISRTAIRPTSRQPPRTASPWPCPTAWPPAR